MYYFLCSSPLAVWTLCTEDKISSIFLMRTVWTQVSSSVSSLWSDELPLQMICYRSKAVQKTRAPELQPVFFKRSYCICWGIILSIQVGPLKYLLGLHLDLSSPGNDPWTIQYTVNNTVNPKFYEDWTCKVTCACGIRCDWAQWIE